MYSATSSGFSVITMKYLHELKLSITVSITNEFINKPTSDKIPVVKFGKTKKKDININVLLSYTIFSVVLLYQTAPHRIIQK